MDRNTLDLGDSARSATSDKPSAIEWEIDTASKKAIERAQQRLQQDIDRHTVNVLAFQAYGKDLIKQWKVSPDAFVQMAMQLAYYRTFGQVGATYESAATRRFRHGRTETCRSVSSQSVDYVKAFDDLRVTVTSPFLFAIGLVTN